MAAEGLSPLRVSRIIRSCGARGRATPRRRTAVLGRTVGGYLFVPLALAFVSAFYYATNHFLGWWQPSESLTDPEILGSAVPALAPIAISLQAGFMEECLFRAVPLSLAALDRAALRPAPRVRWRSPSSCRRSCSAAPTPTTRASLRTRASSSCSCRRCVWALIFLRFGLIPTIVLHALFDLALMSIPIFLVDAPGAFCRRADLSSPPDSRRSRSIIARRLRAGSWSELADDASQWRVATAVVGAPARPAAHAPADTDGASLVARFRRALPALGVAGLVAWALATPFRADVPLLPLTRGEAEAIADAALAARGVVLGPAWRRTSIVRLATDDPTALGGPQVRLARGRARRLREAHRQHARAAAVGGPLRDVRGRGRERAEEWQVTVDGSAAVRQIRHTLPESRPGARLSRDDALALARAPCASDSVSILPR